MKRLGEGTNWVVGRASGIRDIQYGLVADLPGLLEKCIKIRKNWEVSSCNAVDIAIKSRNSNKSFIFYKSRLKIKEMRKFVIFNKNKKYFD